MMSKMHTMRCMYRIWKSKRLLYRRRDLYEPIRVMPASVHHEIRGIARSTICSTERDLLSGIDRFLKVAMPQKLPVWICMMQLILTYRELLGFTEGNRLGLAGVEASMSFIVYHSNGRSN